MYYRDLSDRHHFYLLGQDKPHSISAGIKPLSSAADAKFREMAPNLLLHSKSQNAGPALRGQIKRWLVDADRSESRLFSTLDFFQLVIARQPLARLG